jgi:hypothetical protein
VIFAKQNLHFTVELEYNPRFSSNAVESTTRMTGMLVVLYKQEDQNEWHSNGTKERSYKTSGTFVIIYGIGQNDRHIAGTTQEETIGTLVVLYTEG